MKRYPNCLYLAALLFVLITVELSGQTYTVSQAGSFSPMYSSPISVSLYSEVSEALPIGFNFDFFGNTYSDFYISTNGFITFNPNSNDGCCEGQFIPSPSDPDNLIAGAWSGWYEFFYYDYYDPYNSIYIEQEFSYETIGTAPNRTLHVNFVVSDDCIDYINYPFGYDFQIILYETSNKIEIHTNAVESFCNTMTQGIENSSGTEAHHVTGRNAGYWSASHDYVAFELVPPSDDDAGVVGFTGTVCSGMQDVIVYIKNYGANDIDSVDIEWEFDGVPQTPVTFDSYSLSPGLSTPVTLANESFTFPDTHTLKVWTSMPNGNVDPKNNNDTLDVTLQVAMQGVYTIGGTSPDYATFNSALTDLQAYGICDSVIFNVRDGNYFEQLSTGFIGGAFGDKRVIFQSESGDSSAVQLVFTGTNSSNNFVINLDGAWNITFRNLTLQNSGSSYARVFDIRNGSRNIEVQNCEIKGKYSVSTSTLLAAVYSQGPNNEIKFNNNHFFDGTYGIYHTSFGELPYGKDMVIQNNRFDNFYHRGIHLVEMTSPVIDGNRLANTGTNTNAIYLHTINGDGIQISNNELILTQADIGIRLAYIDSESADQPLVYNNRVSIIGTNDSRGIVIDNLTNVGIYHNSVYISGTDPDALAFELTSSANVDIRNNIFANSGTGIAFKTNTTSSGNHADYNDLFATGESIAAIGASEYGNLTSWQNATQWDSNGISIDPLFVSDTNLHVQQTFLNGIGTPIADVTEDFEGDTRDPASPDIGADEFYPPGNDIGVLSFFSPGLDCNNSQSIIVVVQNFGSSVVDSLTLQWSISGVSQSPIDLVRTIDTIGGFGTDTIHVLLSTENFITDSLYSLKAWTSMPNGTADGFLLNDTSDLNYQLPFNGTYSVGPSNADFPDLTSAVAALEQHGVCGPVRLELQDGTYTEQVTIHEIAGTSAANRVTITSESQDTALVKIQFDAVFGDDNWVIRLSGADYITFSHVCIEGIDVFRTRGIVAVNNPKHIVISDCRFLGTINDDDNSELIYGNDLEGDLDWLIENNSFEDGSHALYVEGRDILNSFSNVTFRNNEMVDQNRYFVAFRYGSGVTIESNNIYRNDVDIFFPTGIFLTDMEGQNLVSSNKIIYDTDGVGIWLNQVNRMDTSSRIKIFNNFISIFDGAYGLRANNSRRVQVYYNNIHNRELSDFSYAFHSSSSDTLDIRNNNFVSAQAAAYVIAYSTDSVRSDNNNFQSPGATLISTYMGGYADLNNWQVASGKDLNSMQVDPQFLSTSDLHVLADTLSGAGTPIAGITEDIDGEPRDPSAPTIGADETFINNLDVAIFALKPEMPFAKGTQDVKLVLYNFGSDDVTTLTADWEVNGSTQSTYNYSGSLLSGTFDTVTIGSHFFDYNLPYTIKAWTFGPNSLADENVANDTMLVSSLYPAVSGIVTIAGSTPDFDSIPQALEAMQNGGVLGGATLNIRTGTYSGNLLFENETFFSCETPVIIQSESGNPADVILDNASLTGIPLEINGADGLTFRNLTIRTLSNVYANAVKIQNQSNCNTFDGCVLEGRVTNSTSSSFAVVLSATDRDTANTLSNNEILNGSYGIYLNGPNQDEERNQITGNTFNEQYYRGVYMDHQIDPEVSNNNFATSTASTGYLAIYLYRSDQNINVSGNDISLPNQGGTGINISLSAQSTGNQGLISNNFVLVGSSSFSQGAQLYANQNLLFAHNTILVEGSNTSSRGLYIQNNTAGGASAVNNNIVNTSGGVAMLVSHVGQLSYSDHNNFLVTGPTLVTEQGTNYTDLAAWQANGYDANSLSVDPAFVSPIDLHVQSAFLNMTGTPVSAVPIDIDGEPRDLLMPDIGADEFNLVSDDIGLLSINYPVQPFPSGVQTVFIKFINNGDDTLITANVDWVINGDTMPTYMWSGLLPSGATYDSLDIGNYDFLPDSIHTIKVWVSDPNGVQDGLSANDTLQVGGLYPGLLGVYTVGGVEPDFEEIKDATSALNNGGAAGPVTFNIRDGIYLDSIHLFEFPGSDCNNPVVFQSESLDAAAVTITNLGVDGYPVHLDGADGITFRFLTLETVNPSFANTVRINGGADCNVFEQNEIVGYIINSSSVLYSTVYDLSGADYSNQYLSNHIQNGSYGLHLTHTGSPLSGTRINNNTLSSAYYTSIYAGNHNGIEVESNEIIGSSYSSFRGIFLYNCDSTISVQRNSIDASNGRSPLILEACQSAVSSPGLVANNFITVGGSLAAKAIDLLNNTNLRIAHNNVHNFCSYGAGFGNTGIYISGGSAHDIRNNIFAGSGAFTTAIQTNNNPSFIHLDFNDLFSANGDIGYWNGTLAADLTAWQSLSSLDANSISQNPEYAGQTDLHVSNILLNGSADPIAGITLDYDGDVREVTPDIGADEFVPAASDDVGAFAFMGPVAPFAEGSQPVQIALKNFGGNNLTSAQVRWLVNGVEQTAFAWSGNLSPGQCDTVTVGTFTFAAYSPHDFIFWTEDPNGVPDSTNINDTLFHDNVYPGLIGTYTVGGVLPDFNLFTQLQSALNLGGILGDVTFEIRNGTYENQILINDFPRLSLSHGVTFKSESDNAEDVKIIRNFSGDNYTVFFNHARNVTLKELTLQSTSGRVVEIANGSSVISILDCILLGEENGYSSTIFATVYSGSTSEDSIRFLNNEIWNGAYGIFLTGSSGDREMQTEVTGNEIIGARVSALYLTFQEGLKISDNFIDMQSAYNRTAVYLTQCHQELLLEKNIVLVDNSGIGLDILSCTMPADGLGRVENNYFFVGGSLKSKGIYDHQNTRIGYSFNTIDVRNTHIESVPFEVLSYASAFLDILNNSLSNFGGGMAFYSYYTTPFDDFNYNNFHTTGPNIARVGGIYPSLFDLQANTGKNLNSVSVDPIFPIIGEPALLQVALDGAATPVSGVAEDYEGDIRNATTPDIGADEFVPVPNDIAVVALVAPATFCGLSASEDVTIRIQNRGSTAQTGFDVSYVMNGNQVTQNIGGLSVAAGQTVDFTFTEKVNLSTVGLYDFMIFSSLGTDSDLSSDTMSNLVVEHIPVLVTGVSNMLPADGEIDLDKSVSLSWNPAPNATLYDIYIWLDGNSKPGSPQVQNISQINTVYSQLNYGQTYNWQVVARNICNQMVESDTLQFTIRELPDLIIDTVIAPLTAFSGQQISVEWIVKNQGIGGTQSKLWTDAVYLSQDATLNTTFDQYLGGIQNLTALDANMSYSQTLDIVIPENFGGNYYVFVYADRYNSLVESNNNNNWDRNVTPIMITVTPSPDLRVTNVSAPALVFSGQPFTVTYTVKNTGTGATDEGNWQDVLRSSDVMVAQNSGPILIKPNHTGDLEPDSSYVMTVQVEFPISTEGTKFINVTTDHLDNVFEGIANSNNSGVSDSIEVVILPPADLIMSGLVIPDTIHNNQNLQVTWNIINQGGSSVEALNNYWYDRMYYSTSPIYNPNFLSLAVQKYLSPPLAVNDTIPVSVYWLVPNNINGHRYIYFSVDVQDRVFEYTFEDNNITRLDSTIYIASPDLISSELIFPDTGQAGVSYSASWNEMNIGPGHLYNRNYRTKGYLSVDSVFNPNDAIEIHSSYYSHQEILVGDTIARNATMNLNIDLIGDYYLHIVIDANQEILESDQDSNNVISRPIFITPAPLSDLVVQNVTTPDTALAGISMPFSYEVVNQGFADAADAGTDSIFISFSPSWNYALSEFVVALDHNVGVDKDSILQVSTNLPIDLGITSNLYYYYILNDAKDETYEGGGEANNITRSDAVFIKPYPSIDLVPDTLRSMSDTVSSGEFLPLDYTIRNIGIGNTFKSTWPEAVFLSVDNTLDTMVDLRLEFVQYNDGVIQAGAISQTSISVPIPNGLFGDFYVFLETDKFDLNGDVNRANNIAILQDESFNEKKIHIKLSDFADLIGQSFIAPSLIESGNLFSISIDLKNQGLGVAGTFKTRIYVSTDGTIGNGDLLLKEYSTSLAAGSNQVDTFDVSVPVSYLGNYFLILSVDHSNLVYEHTGESNNLVTRVIEVTQALPSDLIVESIQLPDSATAGDIITLEWTTRNQGDYPASGLTREIVYMSSDTIWDVHDQFFALLDKSIYLPPASASVSMVSAPIEGLIDDSYYALVQTDARDNILESDETNNYGSSSNQLSVSMKELILRELTFDTIANGEQIYYRLEAPASLAGEAIIVDVKGDSLNGQNDIFIKYGEAPSTADFDFGSEIPFSGNQSATIPDVIPGSYYILIVGQAPTSPQPVTILAEPYSTSIQRIAPSRGSNSGFVTMQIFGTKLDQLDRIQIVQNDTSQYTALLADTFIVVNRGLVLARFNLVGMPVDTYDVECIRPDSLLASLRSSFEVVEGLPAELAINWEITPKRVTGALAGNAVVQFKVDVQNVGESDLIGETIDLEGENFAPLFRHYTDIQTGNSDLKLQIEIEDENGFPGVLRPGGFRSYFIYGIPIGRVFVLTY